MLRLVLVLSCLAAGACAGANATASTARRVSIAELSGDDRAGAVSRLQQFPVVIHFERGDRIPVALTLDSSLASLEPSALSLTVERDFWVLLQEEGRPLLSLDGKDFETRPEHNSFGLGFDVRGDEPPTLRALLRVRPGPR